MADLIKTPLYELHGRLGAKMTAFAGYALPLNYPEGILHEHLHCRRAAGLFDISHMGQCRIDGDGAASALEKLTPGGIAGLAQGAQKYTVLTNPQGGIIDDIIVTRTAAGLHIVVNAACKEKDFAYLRQALPGDCRFEVCGDLALLALQGPEAEAVLAKLAPAVAALRFMQAGVCRIDGVDCLVSRSGYTGEDGFEISLPQTEAECIAGLLLAEPAVAAIGLGARDTLRLEAGLCLYGHELNEDVSPIEAGLGWLLAPKHTNFPGADIILRQRAEGAVRVRAGLSVADKIPLRQDCVLLDAKNRPVGRVTSGSFSPSLGRPVAMALVEPAFSAVGTPLFADVRQNRIEATVSRLPFVPHQYRR